MHYQKIIKHSCDTISTPACTHTSKQSLTHFYYIEEIHSGWREFWIIKFFTEGFRSRFSEYKSLIQLFFYLKCVCVHMHVCVSAWLYVCVCMYVCAMLVCMSVCIHTYAGACMFTVSLHVCMGACMHVYDVSMYVCMSIYMYVCIYVCKNKRVFLCMKDIDTRMHAWLYTCEYLHVCRCVHIHICIYVCIDAFMHVGRVCVLSVFGHLDRKYSGRYVQFVLF